jgi:hypothetical protein
VSEHPAQHSQAIVSILFERQKQEVIGSSKTLTLLLLEQTFIQAHSGSERDNRCIMRFGLWQSQSKVIVRASHHFNVSMTKRLQIAWSDETVHHKGDDVG